MMEWLSGVWAWANIYGRLADCDKDRARLGDVCGRQDEEIKSLRRLFQVGTVTVNSRGVILKAGANFAELSGYTIEELTGMPLKRLIPYRYWQCHSEGFEQVAKGKPVRDYPLEVELRRKDGSEIQIYVSLSEFPNGDGKEISADIRRR